MKIATETKVRAARYVLPWLICAFLVACASRPSNRVETSRYGDLFAVEARLVWAEEGALKAIDTSVTNTQKAAELFVRVDSELAQSVYVELASRDPYQFLRTRAPVRPVSACVVGGRCGPSYVASRLGPGETKRWTIPVAEHFDRVAHDESGKPVPGRTYQLKVVPGFQFRLPPNQDEQSYVTYPDTLGFADVVARPR